MTYKIICVFLIAFFTYLPRVIPLLFFKKPIKNKWFQSFMHYMPYAVLTALTFPAIFFSTNSIWTAIIGTVIALGLSYFKINMAVTAILCVIIVFGFSYII